MDGNNMNGHKIKGKSERKGEKIAYNGKGGTRLVEEGE